VVRFIENNVRRRIEDICVLWSHDKNATDMTQVVMNRIHKVCFPFSKISSQTDMLLLLLLFCFICMKNVLLKYRLVMLIFSEITPKFLSVAMILIVDMKMNISYSMCRQVYCCISVPNFTFLDSLVVTVKPKATENVRTTAMLIFYVQQKYYLKTGFLFSRTYSHNSFQTPWL
jgi:hypothetical protein